jgi:hypothetical protein
MKAEFAAISCPLLRCTPWISGFLGSYGLHRQFEPEKFLIFFDLWSCGCFRLFWRRGSQVFPSLRRCAAPSLIKISEKRNNPDRYAVRIIYPTELRKTAHTILASKKEIRAASEALSSV